MSRRDPGHGLGVAGVGTEPVDGLGGERHEPAPAEDGNRVDDVA